MKTFRNVHRQINGLAMTDELPPRMQWDPDRNLLETELGNGWMVIEWFEMQEGQRVVGALMICPAPGPLVNGVRDGRYLGDRPTDGPVPSGGVTARLLRTVKVGKNADPVIKHYGAWVKEWFGEEARAEFDAHAPLPRGKRRSSRRPDDRYYAELASEYATIAEKSKRPTATLAELRGEPIEKIRSHVHLARANGFLTNAPKPGKAGGKLTPKAKQVLKTAANEKKTGGK